MRMDEGLDTGPVCLVERVPIEPDETAGELHDRLASLGARLMIEALDALEQGKLNCRPQPEQGSYAEKITPAEARLNFRAPAHQLHDRIRGLSPHPGAWCEIELNGKPERIKVLRATLIEQERRAGHGARRRPYHCLRQGRYTLHRSPTRRQAPDDRRGILRAA